jgi:hypothetical protein
MTVSQFLAVLAHTESKSNPNAPLGDDGRALGRWQVHPDWVWSTARRFSLQPLLNESWDRFVERLVTAFYKEHSQYLSDIEVAMFFHLGHLESPDQSGWDKGYAERFEEYAKKLV